MTDKPKSADVQVIARAAGILEALAEHPGGLSLSKIAGYVDLSRSTVHRIVVALCNHNLVRATDTGYQLGPALLRLADASRSNFEFDIHPFLVDLSHELRETVDLSSFTGQTITFVDQVIASRRLRAVSGVGVSFPLYCTAPGKAVLAALGTSSTDLLLGKPLERFTPFTHTERESLDAELEEIRRNGGIAFDREEYTLGICAVGMALQAADTSWYAISVPMPAQRFYGQESRLTTALTRTVDAFNESQAKSTGSTM